MNARNRFALYGSYFLGMSGVGFALPYLSVYLREQHFSDQMIGVVSGLGAFAGLSQFPLGVWSDRVGKRKPFLVTMLILIAISAFLLPIASGMLAISALVIIFSENGLCRPSLESLAGAVAADLANGENLGTAMGELRFWRPASIVVVAVGAGYLAERHGVRSVLWPVAALQALAAIVALGLQDVGGKKSCQNPPRETSSDQSRQSRFGDWVLSTFVGAIILFQIANSSGQVYLGLYLKSEFKAHERYLSDAFIISMIAWSATVWLIGRIADRWGRKPLLMSGWLFLTLRMALLAVAGSAIQVLVLQILDGLSAALFAVAAAAWMTDRVAKQKQVGKAQVIVGSAVMIGAGIGPPLAGLVAEPLGYRGMFWVMAGIAAAATAVVFFFVPESKPQVGQGAPAEPAPDRRIAAQSVD